MSEQERTSQLSALFDGELPSQQADLVIRRAVRDSAMRQRWQHYALIGACVRGEPLAGAGAGSRACLADRVSARIANEADILAPWSGSAAAGSGTGRGVVQFFGRGAMGGAIAAAVAVMAVFVVRSIGPVDGAAGPGELLAQGDVPEVTAAGRTVADSEPRSYTTPGENSALPRLLPNQAPLAHYVVAHSERAASYLGVSYDLTEGAVVMTEDEIAALLR